MKINEFTKADQLIMFINSIEHDDEVFSLVKYGDQAIDYGIANSKKGLSSLLSKLKYNGYISNNHYDVDENGNYVYAWALTSAGKQYSYPLFAKLDENSWFSVQHKENKKIEQPNISENSAAASANDSMKTAFESMAQSFKSMAQAFNSLSISFNKQNDSNVKDLLDSSYQLACNNDAYIAFITSHIDTIVNAIKNGNKSPKEIIETLMEIYSDGINPLVKNNFDLKNMLSPK